MISIWTDDDSTEVVLPTAAELSWSYSDIDKDSSRNDNGLLMRNRIASKVKLKLSWNAEKQPGVHTAMISILKNLPPFFYCKYPDADGTTRTIECYRGDISSSLFRYDSVNGNIWRETKVDFIER